MAAIPPEEKRRLLDEKLGAEEVKRQIGELKRQGLASGNLRAIDILFQEAQWEPEELNVQLRGFYLGTYKRGPPGLQATESFVLTPSGTLALRPERPEVFEELDGLDRHGVLAPIELTVDKYRHIASSETRTRLGRDATVKRINLPPQLMNDWATPPDEIPDEPGPVFVVEPISVVRDVMPADAWVDDGQGRRRRAEGVSAFPVVNKEGEVNVRLSLGDDSARLSVKVTSGDDLLALLKEGDVDNEQEWFDWIEGKALADHESVMGELRAFEGRTVVAFGSAGREIRRRGEGGKQEVISLSGAFLSTTQWGFMMGWDNAVQQVMNLGQGDPVMEARPSAAAAPRAPTKPELPIEDALLKLIGKKGATKDDLKSLLKVYGAEELVDAVTGLTEAGTIRQDGKRYVKAQDDEEEDDEENEGEDDTKEE